MALWGTPDTLRSQLISTERFQIALDYLARALTAGSDEHTRINAVPAGEACQVELGDGVFAIEQAYDTKLLGQGRFEAHERHIDLQAIVSGRELIRVTGLENLEITENAFEERDVCFFADTPQASDWRMNSGEVAVFFPTDVHMPSLADGESGRVQKTVVKVAV
ncbi:MAG: YhcH/YjgK/YiaL family protein [Opitutaceae bacterium]